MNKPLWEAMIDGMGKDFTPVSKASIDATGAADVMPKDDDGIKKLLVNLAKRSPPDPKAPSITDRTSDVLFAYSDLILNEGPSDATPETKKAQIGFIYDTASTEHQKTMSHF